MYQRGLFKNLFTLKTFASFKNRFGSWSNQIMQGSKVECTSSFKEIKIPIEYGHLAAKEYGPSTGDKLLVLHGWQDNAGSFDPLIPLLSPNLHIVAPDYAGHGFSSHKPLGYPYYTLDYVNHVKVIADFLNWKKFSILGHSMGSSLALMFSSIYPDMVNKVIGIDLLKPLTYPAELAINIMRNNIVRYVKLDGKLKQDPPTYLEDEALQIIIDSRFGAISKEAAKILMKRGIKQLENGKVTFSRDIRIQSVYDSGLACIDVLKFIISNLKCDLLLIKAKESPIYTDEESLKEFLEIYKTKCKTFKLVEVEGDHFVHMNNPKSIASVVNPFLQNVMKSSL